MRSRSRLGSFGPGVAGPKHRSWNSPAVCGDASNRSTRSPARDTATHEVSTAVESVEAAQVEATPTVADASAEDTRPPLSMEEAELTKQVESKSTDLSYAVM